MPKSGLDRLRAYAVAHPIVKGPTCTTCRLPAGIRDEVHRGRNEVGLTYPQLEGFLRDEHKQAVSRHSIAEHFRKGHDAR